MREQRADEATFSPLPSRLTGMIWAQGRSRAIGRDGALPWHLPEDLAHFKRVTTGHPVIMGRRTWDSIPDRFRPLPGRRNIVLSRKTPIRAEGAEVVGSLEEALTANSGEEVWIIGGASVYEAALPLADVLVVTEVDVAVEADAFAPEIDSRWRRSSVHPVEGWNVSVSGLRYRIGVYERRGAPATTIASRIYATQA